MCKIKCIGVAIGLSLSLPVFAWDAAGHEVVAQVAYARLTPLTKRRVERILSARFHTYYDDGRFLKAAIWPDQLRRKTEKYTTWHYIDLPITIDGIAPIAPSRHNVVWGISRAIHIATDKTQPLKRRAQYLSFLIHFVGDIHQPLHCATRYTKRTPPPQGDQGGNLFRIKTSVAKNLHAYWDNGLGQFYSRKTGTYMRFYHIVKLATQWSAEFPPSFFGKQLVNQKPSMWAQESFHIAKHVVYQLPENSKPSRQYKTQGRRIVRERVVLAGYRLAHLLNKIFD